MSSGTPSVDEGPPKKRIRKGTKSCWECKRRKIRCQLSSEDVPVCAGCLARGSTCLSQEYPEERDTSGGNQVGERLGRVELLLERLVAKISAFEEEEAAQKILTPESSNNDISTHFPSNVASAAIDLKDNIPYISLFDAPSMIGMENSPQPMNTAAATPTSQAGCKSQCIVPKVDRIRNALLELLPSQKDTDLIYESSSSWLLIHMLTAEHDKDITKSIFELESIQKASPTKIARTLLYLAVSMQQLHDDFDKRRLHLYPSVELRMERYITTVSSLVTSDDELMASMEGLECLVLLGLFQMNAGNPRRAWLIFRRAMNIGQLIGIDRKGASNIQGGKDMWYQIVLSERYLCLLLGLPAGSTDPEITPEDRFDNPKSNHKMLFRRRLCNISTRIIERNQAQGSQAYATTQNIDEQLDALAHETGPEWWALPASIPNDRSPESAATFDSLMSQIWFFQLESLLHLPFMLRASTERRYEYSKFSCLKASREVMFRYLVLRKADNKSFFCHVVDFGALTAAVTLFLGLLDSDEGISHEQKQQRDADRTLVQTVAASMEEIAQARKDVVATQSVNVIRALFAFDSSTGTAASNFKLTIPYFGTITISRAQAQAQVPTPQPSNPNTPVYLNRSLQREPVSINHQLPSGHWPGVTFTPSYPSQAGQPVSIPVGGAGGNGAEAIGGVGAQYAGYGPYGPLDQPPPIEDWALGEADTIFFDSLLSKDIEGNWLF